MGHLVVNHGRRFFLLGSTALAGCATAGSLALKGKRGVSSGVPVNTVLPVITGSFVTGSTATCVPGTYTNSPTSIARQWKRAGSPIGGATGLTYVFQVADEGLAITVAETPSNSFGAGAVATSAAVFPTPAGSIPFVAPGAGWNGTALSGGIPPSFAAATPPLSSPTKDPITRVTAKPAIHWVVPSGRCLSPTGDLIVGVDADAGGTRTGSLFGIKQVDFWVEGTTQTVTTPQFLTWTENGVSKTAWGYFIKLRESDFSAHLTGSEARLFATAIPNDATMQNRIIGYDLVNGGLYDGNYPLSVFPRAVLNDHSYTVNAANNDVSPNFTTIKKALTQAASDSAEFPLLTFTATANYELENLTNHAAGHGFCTFATSGSFVATLGRAVAFTPGSPSSWPWTPGWDAIEFRGSNIVFQQRNWAQVLNDRPCWFNGNQWTNNCPGGRDTNYWNNSSPPYVGASGASYVDATYSEFTSGMLLNNFYVINAQVKQTGGSVVTGVHLTQNTFTNDFTNNYFLNTTTNRISITYTNPGGHTTATVSRPAGALYTGTSPQNMTLQVDGSTVATIRLGYYSTDPNPTVTDVVAAINAFGNGWSAAVLNGGGIWPGATIGFNGGDWAFTGNAFNSAYATVATPDPHGEWWQGFTGGLTRENVILRNDIVLNNASLPFIENDAAVQYDTIIKGQVWLGTATNPFYISGQFNNHFVIQNNTTNGQWTRREYINGNPAGSPDPGDQVYTLIDNNIIGQIYVFGYSGSGTFSPYSSPMNNNDYAVGNATMNGPSDSGNVNFTGTAFSALFINAAIYDLRPVPAGILLGTQFARVSPNDGRRLPFANPDIAGAWSQNDPQYVPPF